MDAFVRRIDIWGTLATTRRPYSLLELARRFRVTKNTIAHDLDLLGEAGAVILSEATGQTERFWLSPDAPGPRSRTPASALHRALLVAAGLGQDAGVDWSGVPVEVRAPRPKRGPAPELLKALTQAIRDQRRLRLEYLGRHDKRPRPRVVDPTSIRIVDGLPYLLARTPDQGEPRSFALDRIVESSEMGAATPRQRLEDQAFGITNGEEVEAIVRFSRTVADFIREREWHPAQKVVATRDGGVELRVRTSGLHEFVGWVMSWGDHAELISPRHWRAEAARRAAAMHRTYSRRRGRAR